MLKLLNKTLAIRFGNNKEYIATNIIKLTKKFFGYDFLAGILIAGKLTIYCPDCHIANELFLKKTLLIEYINNNLSKYGINNYNLKEIRIVTKSLSEENIYIEKNIDDGIKIEYAE